MIKRDLTELINRRLKKNPAVSLVGPRQCGKTTLAKSLKGMYFDLETESDRIKLDAQWPDIINSDKLIILDEAQTVPEIFPRLRSAIDKQRRRMGRFMILGSVSPALMQQVSESLAGRLGLVELTPFILHELPKMPVDDLWLYGGYPDGGILDSSQYFYWQNDYITLLAQRDLPQWGLPAKPMTIQRLMKMIAAVHGQNWNASQIGSSIGLNYQTINSYLEYIQGCFIVRLLEPYTANISKRIRKSPKIYWRDSGLLHTLMQVRDMDNLFSQPWVGASWEGFVVEQIINNLKAADKVFNPYYLRTSDKYEIDLILDFGGRLYAIEVKLTSSPDSDDVSRFRKAAEIIEAKRCLLISRTQDYITSENFVSANIQQALDFLMADTR
ncbi:MAG: ATP-binding protein [Sedimentisphaerales bacterium]|nr:ATP-binding protein [Sedimentisphaerales bacterium]